MSFLGGKVGPSTSHRVWEIRYLSVLPGVIDKYVVRTASQSRR